MCVWPAFQFQPELLEYFHSRQDPLDSHSTLPSLTTRRLNVFSILILSPSFFLFSRLTIAVMRVWPAFQFQPELLEYFHSRQDLLDSLMTSSHVPLYLDAEQPFWTKFRTGFYVDGGLVDLVPPVPGSIKVGKERGKEGRKGGRTPIWTKFHSCS